MFIRHREPGEPVDQAVHTRFKDDESASRLKILSSTSSADPYIYAIETLNRQHVLTLTILAVLSDIMRGERVIAYLMFVQYIHGHDT